LTEPTSYKADPFCPDKDLGAACQTKCNSDLTDCYQSCSANDNSCIRNCTRSEHDCIQKCPCQRECPAGCRNCSHPLCSPPDSSILVISSLNTDAMDHNMYSYARIMDWNGNILNDSVNFVFGENTGLNHSCSTILNGELWVFGAGYPGKEDRQYSKVKNCKLERIGDLPFDLELAACNNFMFEIEKTLICFDKRATQTCHLFNGSTFEEAPSSIYAHAETHALGNYRGSPFVTGCMYENIGCPIGNAATEIFNIDSMSWFETTPYPFTPAGQNPMISLYATASTPTAVYVIGGATDTILDSALNTIAKFEDGHWSKAGELIQPRFGHSVITSGNTAFIVGGTTDFEGIPVNTAITEVWELDYEVGREIGQLPSKDYTWGAGLFFIDPQYCS